MGLFDRRRSRRWASTQHGIAADNSDEPRLNAAQALAMLNGAKPNGNWTRIDSTVGLTRCADRGRVLRAVEGRQ